MRSVVKLTQTIFYSTISAIRRSPTNFKLDCIKRDQLQFDFIT